jgi:hypothetical protein
MFKPPERLPRAAPAEIALRDEITTLLSTEVSAFRTG